MKGDMGNISALCKVSKGKVLGSQKQLIDAIFSRFRLMVVTTPRAFDGTKAMNDVKEVLFRGADTKTCIEEDMCQLVGYWKQYDLQFLYNNEDVISAARYSQYKCWMLSARVIQNVQKFFNKVQYRKTIENGWNEKTNLISDFIYKEEIEFNPGKNFWVKKGARFSMKHYHHTNFSNQNQAEKEKNYNQAIYQLAKQQKIDIIVELYEFLAKIGMVELVDCKADIQNGFMNALQNIKKTQQRELLIKSYSCNEFEDCLELAKKGQKQALEDKIRFFLPNYAFYKNALKARRKTTTLDKLHQQFENYDFLEGVHDYVQWMFPNHYGSAFNSSSSPLNYIQSELFIRDEDVKTSLLYSIFLFTDFMGLSLNFENLQFQILSEKRLADVILVHYHNHLRIMRILACLSVTGFRSLALRLIQFLDYHSRKGELLEKERGQFERSWEIYGDEKIKEAKEMCFLESDTFTDQEIFFKKFVNCARQILSSNSHFAPNESSESKLKEKMSVEKEQFPLVNKATSAKYKPQDIESFD